VSLSGSSAVRNATSTSTYVSLFSLTVKKNARNNEQPDALRVLVQTAEANATAKQFHVNAFTSAVTCLEQDLNERVKVHVIMRRLK